MVHAHRIGGKAVFKERRELAIKVLDLRRAEGAADAGAGADPSTPGLMGVGRHHVEGEGLDRGKAGNRDVAGPSRIDSSGAAERPFWVVLDD